MTSSFGWTEWLSMMGSFVVVLGLLVATLIVINRMCPKMGISGSKRIQPLEVQNLGGRQKLVLVRINNEQVLVGLSAQNMTSLGSFPYIDPDLLLDKGDAENDLTGLSESAPKDNFKHILSQVFKK